MLKRDEETHGEVVLAEGLGFFVRLYLVCYWDCHLYIHLFFVFTLNVFEKPPEGSSAGLSGGLACKRDNQNCMI